MLTQQKILKEIVDLSITSIILIDGAGSILAYNRGVEKLVGWKREEEIGKNIQSLFVGEQGRKPFEQFLSEILSWQGKREVELQSGDGRRVVAECVIREVKTQAEGPRYICYFADMTEHILLEEERRKNDREIRTLTANIPGIVFRSRYEKNRQMLFIDTAIEALSGIRAEELVDGDAAYADLMSEEDCSHIWHEIGLSLARNDSYTVEYRMLDREGRTTWVSENGRVVTDEHGVPQTIVGVISDNTLIKTTSAEFESTVRALNRATPVIEFNLQGCVINVNPQFLELLGYEKKEDVIGHHHRIFCTPEYVDSEEYVTFWERLRAGEYAKGEYLRVGKGGREVWIQATYNPIFDADGKPYKVMKFASDLSERRAMEEELRVAIDRAEAAVAARGNFMANMSHEIRTPMNAIIGFSEVLLDSSLDEEQRHQMQIVRNASRSLLRLLNEILDMAKLEKGAVEIEIRDFNFKELCDQVIASLKINADRKNLALILDTDSSIPEFLKGDSLRIQQIFLNLLSNAIKFTEEGSVTLRIRYENGVLDARVTDTGIGIDKAYIKRIFNPFTQAEASTSRRFGGTGLGTAISHQLVTLMGGEITVESEINKGSTFRVKLPVEVGVEADEKMLQADELEPLYVLAVDDTRNNLELVNITMTRGNHRLEMASDGEEAVTARKEKAFDLILMDMQMPGMDGLEATRQIRLWEKENGVAPIPIIAFSASVLERDRQDALEAGMNGFTSKPLDPPAFFSEIARVLEVMADEGAPVERGEPAAVQESGNEGLEEPQTSVSSVDGGERRIESRPEAVDINWEAGLHVWGDEELLRNSIAAFLVENQSIAAKVDELLQQEQLEKIAALGHKVCGAAGNMSLLRVHHLARDLERGAHTDDREQIRSVASELVAALVRVERELCHGREQELKEKKVVEVRPPQTPAEIAELQEHLGAILDACDKGEVPEREVQYLHEVLPADLLEPVVEALEQFDFTRAREIIIRIEKRYTEG